MKKEIGDFPLIILAGGRSSRMGTPKGLLDYQGRPWLAEQLCRFEAASGRQAIIVLGFHQVPYFKQIPWLKKAVNHTVSQLGLDISVVLNPNPEQGQYSSLQWAIAFLSANQPDFAERRTTNAERSLVSLKIPGAFILPIDVPCPGKEVFEKLAGAFSHSIDAAIPRFQSKGGHPVLLGSDFLSRLAKVSPASPSARLDLQIQTLPVNRTAFVPVKDRSICLNMNVLDEFQDYTRREKEPSPT